MILKRTENDGIVKALYESSNILGSSYNKVDQQLTIIFTKGTRYVYDNVTAADYMRFETADSQGKILNANIKKNHTFAKMDDINPQTIITEITNLKSEATQDELKELMTGMASMVGYYEKNQDMPTDSLIRMRDAITKVLETVNEPSGQPVS